MSELVRLDVEPPVAVITLDRADRLNALTYPMIAAFRRAVDEARDAADAAVRTRLEKSPDEAERIEAMLKARRDGGAR